MAVYRLTVDLRFGIGSGRGTNSWCVRTTDASPADQVEEWAAVIESFYVAVRPNFPDDSSFTWDGTVTELGSSSPEFRPAEDGWVVEGNNPSAAYGPAPAMACVTWRTSLASRSGRGRTFLGPLSDGAYQADGTLNPDALEDIRAGAALVVDANNGALNPGALAIWSEADSVARDIVSATVNDVVAVLRSRR